MLTCHRVLCVFFCPERQDCPLTTDARSTAAFRSSFYLLPPDGACFKNSEGTAKPLDFLSPSPWLKYGLSPMTSHLLDGGDSSAREEAIDDAATADPAVGAPLGGMQQMGHPGSAETAAPSTAVASPRQLVDPSEGRNRRDSDSSESMESESSDVSSHESNPNLADVTSDPNILAYLERTLRNVQTFRKQLSDSYDPAKKHLYPPLVILSSRKTPTVKGCVVDSDQEIQDGQYDRLLFGEGGEWLSQSELDNTIAECIPGMLVDGIILHQSATALPDVWQPHVVSSLESGFGQSVL